MRRTTGGKTGLTSDQDQDDVMNLKYSQLIGQKQQFCLIHTVLIQIQSSLYRSGVLWTDLGSVRSAVTSDQIKQLNQQKTGNTWFLESCHHLGFLVHSFFNVRICLFIFYETKMKIFQFLVCSSDNTRHSYITNIDTKSYSPKRYFLF